MDPISPEAADTSRSLAHHYLAQRGIQTATVEAFGIEIDTEPTAATFKQRLGFDGLPEGRLDSLAKQVLWVPCRDGEGKTVSWIARPLPAIGEAKFLNRTGEAFPFIPKETWEAKDKSNKPLILTEGPVKALAVTQSGQLSIGLGGVWMAVHKRADGTVELVRALNEFHWLRRTVYLAFDSDSTINPDVKQALLRTYLVLYKLGAKVRFLSWLRSEGKGIDDYLYAKELGGEEPRKALALVLDRAQGIDAILDPEDLTMMQKELAIANLPRSHVSQFARLIAVRLKVRASALEQDVLGNAGPANNKFELVDPEPWPHLFEGAELLAEIVEFLQRHVVLSEDQAIATALWIFITYLDNHIDVLPILAITSPEKRCGKTTLLTVLQRLARRPLSVSNVSVAALFRSIEKWTPTLLVDEADTFLKEDKELRGILNAGHVRASAHVLRVSPETLEIERFSVWGPKCIACIGKLPGTLADRSIEIRLQRKTKAEFATPLRDAAIETFERLRRQLMSWAGNNGERIKAARPTVPAILNDRAADNWQPLLAIGQTLGGDWLERAIRAATALSVDDTDEESLRIRVLAALQRMFESGVVFLSTTEIVESLNLDDEAPWAGWPKGMTAEKLANNLRSFSVKPKQKRRGGEPVRGYLKEDLKPVFDRYLFSSSPPPPEKPIEPVTPPREPLPDLIGYVTGSKTQPVTSHLENSDPLRTESALGLDSREGVTSSRAKTGGGDRGGTLNGVELILDEEAKIECARRIFGASEIAGPDEPSPDISETTLSPENGYGRKLPPANKAKPLKPSLTHAKDRSPIPSYPRIEKHLLTILAPHDCEGGLSYDQFLRRAGLPDEVFDQTLDSLCRRGGPVYQSSLNGRYQFSPRYAEILACEKAKQSDL